MEMDIFSEKIRIAEIFESIQGEGNYAGVPALFIRVAGCNRRCEWCDTKYSWEEGKEMSIDELVKRILESSKKVIVFTGGEPLIYIDKIVKLVSIIRETEFKFDIVHREFHLETNGDLLVKNLGKVLLFDYIAVSPKEREVAEKIYKERWVIGEERLKIKVVTDLEKVGVDMLEYADMLMPLTTGDEEKDREIARKVWEYCVKNNKYFSPRLHVWVFGAGARGV